ncbi:hypothetical protein BD309DRAFT_461539 [Dichomitus squalens]|uniref:Uncharacterized protein n=1 Tax=Dichomitus squalens TaxID=114155 RepID=A0A4Q9PSJ5_9APHY|nr:hypothetical protein BD309DRAFT_461539 [Dichomitus squalens]TBU57379.1 hypothetical protein BD310DRAFT_929597 [Dichomitus squalens]
MLNSLPSSRPSDAPPGPTTHLETYLLAGNFVVGVGYGLQLILWFLCTSYLWRQRSRSWKIIFLLCFLALLLSVETIYAIAEAHSIQLAYVNHRGYPGGPWQYQLDKQNTPTTVLLHTSLFTLTFLGDSLVLWRCWVVWSAFETCAAILVNIFPALSLLASVVVGVLWIVTLSTYHADSQALETAYYAISIILNGLLTSLITFKLLSYRRSVLKLLPSEHGSQYLSLTAIVVESAAIHTAFALVFVVSYGLESPINEMFVGFASAAQQVATYLIIYRVADGKAWTRGMQHSKTMTSMRFDEPQTDSQSSEALPSLPNSDSDAV